MNLAKEGGWDKYKMLTDGYSQVLRNYIETEETVEEKMNRFEKIHDKIKYKAFGKVSIGEKSIGMSEVDLGTPDDEKAKSLYEEQEKRASEAIEKIKKN